MGIYGNIIEKVIKCVRKLSCPGGCQNIYAKKGECSWVAEWQD